MELFHALLTTVWFICTFSPAGLSCVHFWSFDFCSQVCGKHSPWFFIMPASISSLLPVSAYYMSYLQRCLCRVNRYCDEPPVVWAHVLYHAIEPRGDEKGNPREVLLQRSLLVPVPVGAVMNV